MNLTCIGDILSRQIPSLIRNETPPDWYRVHVGKTSRIPQEGNQKYQLNLATPYSDKLRYFEIIISNCVTCYFNDFKSNFESSLSIEHRKFLVDKYLNREVVQMIHDLAETTADKGLLWANHNSVEYKKNREVIFILYMIKYHLLWLYLEIKALTEAVIFIDYYNLENLLAEHFYEYEPSSPIITEKQEN